MTHRPFALWAVLFVRLVLAAQAHADDVPVGNAVAVTPGQVELVLSAPPTFLGARLRGDPGRRQPPRYYVNLSPASLTPASLSSSAKTNFWSAPPAEGGSAPVSPPALQVRRRYTQMQTALGSTALTRRLLQTWQDLSLAFRPLSPLPFLPAWGLEQACRDVGCNVSLSGVFTVDSGIHRIHLPKPEESPDDAFSPVEHALGVILTGGVAMHDVWLLTVGIGLLLSFLGGGGLALLLSGRKRRKKADKWEARIAYLEKAVNRAGVLNNQFFHSLEITQKRLESLLTQADWAEQNLRRLLTQTAAAGDKGGGRTDAYTTAALLLSEGDGVQQVARVLKLPLAQVRLLQELQEHLQKEKGAGSQEKVASPGTGAPEVTLSHGPARPLNGSFRSGTHLAANGREL